jgi:hypothetical protein
MADYMASRSFLDIPSIWDEWEKADTEIKQAKADPYFFE